MAEDPKVAQARRDAAASRERLLRSAHQLQARVSPARLANEAVEGARDKGSAALDGAVKAAQRRPGMAVAVALGLLAFLSRRRIGRLIHRPKIPTLAGHAQRALPRPSGDDQ